MNTWPNAFDRTEHFRFESSDCLYRDHRGNRVLADWEGPGTIHLIRSDVSFQINGLDIGDVLFPLSFEDFTTISAMDDGAFEATITSKCLNSPLENLGYVWLELDRFSVTNPYSIGLRNWKVQNLSAPVVLDSTFEDRTIHRYEVASLLNACSFDLLVPANCHGIRIGKTYDQFHGRQCARVFSDNEFKGLWYLPRQNRVQRWAKASFGFILEPRSTKSTIRIGIDPPGGTPMWSMSEISVEGLVLKPSTVGY